MLWFDAQYNSGRLHGVFTSYHDNGNVETKAEYKKGKLNGYHAKYNKYGSLMEEGFFDMGREHGDCKSYHEDGQLARSALYEKGKLVHLLEFDEDGNEIKSQEVAP